MLILDDQKMVWVSCPRTGTHSLYRALSSIGGKHPTQQLTKDGWPPGAGFHETNIPAQYKDYTVLGVCRNPYARVVSCWRALGYDEGFPQPAARHRCIQLCGDRPLLSKFIRKFLLPTVVHVHLTHWPCKIWYERAKVSPDHYLRTEDLKWSLAKLGIMVDVPLLNESGAGPFWKTWYDKDPAAVPLVQEWAACDFDEFGYNR